VAFFKALILQKKCLPKYLTSTAMPAIPGYTPAFPQAGSGLLMQYPLIETIGNPD